jgi:uncharacterized protein with von Willebrand factor type A (vWA) domain
MNSPGQPGLEHKIVTLVQTLRQAGLPLGIAAQLDALHSVAATGVERRGDVYWALHAALVSSPEHGPVFQQAFTGLFGIGRGPGEAEVPPLLGSEMAPAAGARRLGDALARVSDAGAGPQPSSVFALASWQERLGRLDFEQMSLTELAQARALLRTVTGEFKAQLTRRSARRQNRGAVDFPMTLRQSLRTAGEPIRLFRKRPRKRPPTLVLLCDISGSMGRYSRMFLHFAHAMSNARDRVHTLVFGTRLTNISRSLQRRDVDAALDRVSEEVLDWHGGTRIGECLKAFNQNWSRRLLSQGGTVILLSDGLERDSRVDLDFQARRLSLSTRRFIWLNPLLRYEQFEPRASGVRALLPHVDEFRSAHNVATLLDLARLLA